MPEPLVLYSANTLLAYRINEHFYGQSHFVWCSPFFSAPAASIDVQMPPSSTPCDICRTYLNDTARRDWHSIKLRDHRNGLKQGMDAKLADCVITNEQYRELDEIVSRSSFDDFRPLLYIIPFAGVRKLAETVFSSPESPPILAGIQNPPPATVAL
jgi:hypothetical protein